MRLADTYCLVFSASSHGRAAILQSGWIWTAEFNNNNGHEQEVNAAAYSKRWARLQTQNTRESSLPSTRASDLQNKKSSNASQLASTKNIWHNELSVDTADCPLCTSNFCCFRQLRQLSARFCTGRRPFAATIRAAVCRCEVQHHRPKQPATSHCVGKCHWIWH